MKVVGTTALVSAAATALLGLTTLSAQAVAPRTIWVQPGVGTISAAVAAAAPGDTLRLEKGSYQDSAVITKTLTIRGSGWDTIIKPPDAFVDNMCNTPAKDGSPASEEGLCPLGAVDANFNPNFAKPVTNVTIADLRLTGFSDSGVLGFNTKGLHVSDVRSDHNGGYGIARFASTDSVLEHNWSSWNGEAGLYMGDSPHANSVLRQNKADHNGYGLFMRDSTGLTAVDNQVWANDKACPASGGPPLSGIGIALVGVHDTLVTSNGVSINRASGPSFVSGGIVVLSPPRQGGAISRNNTIRDNVLHDNSPFDLFSDGSGTGNRFLDNECATSQPPGLCGS